MIPLSYIYLISISIFWGFYVKSNMELDFITHSNNKNRAKLKERIQKDNIFLQKKQKNLQQQMDRPQQFFIST
jgi:hypothetical protein